MVTERPLFFGSFETTVSKLDMAEHRSRGYILGRAEGALRNGNKEEALQWYDAMNLAYVIKIHTIPKQ